MSEYYAIPEYAKDNLNNEMYAFDQFRNQIYLDIGKDEVHQIFAKKCDNNVFYAQDNAGNFILPVQKNKPCYFFNGEIPLFPKNSENVQIYGQFCKWEIYPNNGINEIYLTDSKGNECYARDKNGQYYFACKNVNGELVQFHAKDKHLKDIPLFNKNGEICYLINLNHNKPMYVVDNDKEIYLKSGNKEIYARNLKNLPIYALEKNRPYFALDENNLPYYAGYLNSEFYPKYNNEQFYKTILNKEIYASRGKNKQFYAKNEIGEILAKNETIPYYAQIESKELYPCINNLGQYYKMIDNTEIAASDENGLFYYAQTNTNVPFYPMDFRGIMSSDEEELSP